MGNKPLALVSLLFLVLVTSGCVNTSMFSGNRPEDVAKTIAQVQDYLEDHPDSDLHVTYNSEGYVRSAISELTDKCGPYFKIIDYWKVVLDDPFTDSSLTVWIEKDTNQMACLYGEGVDSPPPILPDTQKKELVISGFSRIEISEGLTEYDDNKLTVTVRNPNPERITVKKVTASYLDDIVSNLTNSGILSQGDYFTYVFDLSRSITDDVFWVDLEVLYDDHDTAQTNQKSKGSIISGLDVGRILHCSKASFELTKESFYIGTRIFEARMMNTGDVDLSLKVFIRDENDELSAEPAETLQVVSGGTGTVELTGLTKIQESILFVSEACPGASQVVFIEDIPGLN